VAVLVVIAVAAKVRTSSAVASGRTIEWSKSFANVETFIQPKITRSTIGFKDA